MGMEIEINSLEDMCALMCDNIIPKGIKVEVTEDINGMKYVRMSDEVDDEKTV